LEEICSQIPNYFYELSGFVFLHYITAPLITAKTVGNDKVKKSLQISAEKNPEKGNIIIAKSWKKRPQKLGEFSHL
jgi:hypothetical protein